MSRRWSPRGGVNLIEVLFALAILTIYALGMIQTCMKSQELNRRNQELEMAYRYGQDRMEYYVRMSGSPANWSNGILNAYPANTYRFCGDYDYRTTTADTYNQTGTNPVRLDQRFCQRLDVVDIATNLKRLTVTTYLQNPATTSLQNPATAVPGPYTSKPNGGRVLVLSTLVRRP